MLQGSLREEGQAVVELEVVCRDGSIYFATREVTLRAHTS